MRTDFGVVDLAAAADGGEAGVSGVPADPTGGAAPRGGDCAAAHAGEPGAEFDGWRRFGWDIIHTGSYAPFLLCCNVRSISIHNHTHHPSAAASMVHAYGHAAGHILIDNLTVARGDEGSAAIGIVDANATGSGSLAKLTLRGIAVVDKAGSSYTAMPYVLSGATAIGELVIDSVDMDKFTALFDSNGTTNITTIKGAGVLGTGTSVPDSVMANNSLYLSSTASGALSMKVAGTAKRVTLT